MKKYKNILLIFLLGVSLSSCYEEEFFVDDNVTSDGFHYPMIQIVSVDNTPTSGDFAEGSTANVMVQYWSIDPVRELQLFATENGTESLYSTTAYSYNFDPESGAEIMNLSYIVATGTSGTSITLRVVVVTENELTREGSVSIDVN